MLANKGENNCKILQNKEIEKNIFSIICKFNKSILNKTSEKKELFKTISLNCKDKEVWALLGEVEEKRFICLQVASSKNIEEEIKSDLECMLPFNEHKDTKYWSSKFHKNIFKVKYGLDIRCQKYNDMYNKFENFCIIAINVDKYLNSIDIEKCKEENYAKNNYAEVKFAYETRALYWNPNSFNGENQILKGLEEGTK